MDSETYWQKVNLLLISLNSSSPFSPNQMTQLAEFNLVWEIAFFMLAWGHLKIFVMTAVEKVSLLLHTAPFVMNDFISS